jgi:Ger(x)C family germination protein
MPSSMLTKMLKDHELTSQAPVVTLFDFLCCLIRKTKCPVMPIVRILEDDDKQRLEVDGCAVFKSSRMVGTFDEAQTRGMLFIENKVKAGVIMVTVEDAVITAEIRDASSRVRPHLYEDGSIKYDVEVKVTAGIGDQTGDFNAAAPENIPKLLNAIESAINAEIQSAVETSKQYNADVFGFGEYIKRRYPDQWPDIENKWDDIYPNVAVDISVKAKSDGNGRISIPLVPETI